MTIPFHEYLGRFFLAPLPWRSRFLGVVGGRVCSAARVVVAARNAYVCAAAIGRARPDLLPKLFQSCCEPRTWRRVFAQAAAEARGRIEAAGGSPRHFDELFPEDFEPGLFESTAPFDSAYAVAQGRVLEGLALGKEHPELTARLLRAQFRSVRKTAKEAGIPLPPEMKSFKDFEEHLLSLVAAWETGRDPRDEGYDEEDYLTPREPAAIMLALLPARLLATVIGALLFGVVFIPHLVLAMPMFIPGLGCIFALPFFVCLLLLYAGYALLTWGLTLEARQYHSPVEEALQRVKTYWRYGP